MSDAKLTQLKTWLNTYLTIARAYLKVDATYDLKLYFITAPPETITIHCSTKDYRKLTVANDDFVYNGPPEVCPTLTPQLFCVKSGVLVPVLSYHDYFSATLISVNPEYSTDTPVIKAKEVVVQDFVAKSGGQLTGPLLMPDGWKPNSSNELVSKGYVESLLLELDTRIGIMETSR